MRGLIRVVLAVREPAGDVVGKLSGMGYPYILSSGKSHCRGAVGKDEALDHVAVGTVCGCSGFDPVGCQIIADLEEVHAWEHLQARGHRSLEGFSQDFDLTAKRLSHFPKRSYAPPRNALRTSDANPRGCAHSVDGPDCASACRMAIVDFALAVIARVDNMRSGALLLGEKSAAEAVDLGATAFILWCRAIGRSVDT